jgi:hypothetical protein
MKWAALNLKSALATERENSPSFASRCAMLESAVAMTFFLSSSRTQRWWGTFFVRFTYRVVVLFEQGKNRFPAAVLKLH